ncbi:unnamed protein product [Cyclocybe aegerita]|uniref:protein-tyrosine-phosphatase n=1 Tax=Cyclocybe aegerita TaxID=1973307 RepID=A0A8S0WDQ4_CYCAE|nr:unnamed protein product [Cyclocybe aegerita]
MIRFDNMPPEVMQAMCTPMHQILPPSSSHSHHPHLGALYLGSLAAAQDAPLLRSQGISHIVSVLDSPWAPSPSHLEREGFSVYKIEVGDDASVDLRPFLEAVCANIEGMRRMGRGVLVHCQQGVSRSAAIVIAYLIAHQAMSYDTALTLVRRKRACVRPNSGFVRALQEWEGVVRSGGTGGQRPPIDRRFTN